MWHPRVPRCTRHFRMGSLFTEPSRAKIQQCPLLLRKRTKWYVAANAAMGHFQTPTVMSIKGNGFSESSDASN